MTPTHQKLPVGMESCAEVTRSVPFNVRCMALLFILFGGLTAAVVFQAQRPPRAAIMLGIGSVSCVILGCGSLLSRIRLHVDRRTRTIRVWWGIGTPLLRIRTQPLTGIPLVTVSHPKGEMKPRRCGCYPVVLQCDRVTLILDDCWEYARAHALAQHFGRCLDTDVYDETCGQLILQNGQNVKNFNCTQRLTESDADPSAELPISSQIHVRRDNGRVIVRIPAKGLRMSNVASAALGAAVVIGLFLEGRLSFAVGGLLFYLGWLVYELDAAIRWEEVHVSSGAIRCFRVGLFRRHVGEIGREEIEEMEIACATSHSPADFLRRKSVLRVLGSQKMIECGGQLSPEELLWLRSMVRRALICDTGMTLQ